MPKRKVDRNAGAYPQQQIVRRIEARAAEKGLTEGKQIAGVVDAAPSWWSERKNLKRDLTLPDLSALAEALAPDEPGWPFLDDHYRRALARGLAEIAKENAGGPGEASLKPARAGGRAPKGQRR